MEALKHAHSGLRWLLLAFLLIAIISHFVGRKKGLSYNKNHKKYALFALILTHIQLVIGFILYFKGNKHVFTEDTMSITNLRFYSVEHLAGMLIAIILITIGYSSAKRLKEDRLKFKKIFTFYLIGLILILASIPWPFRSELGGSWF